MKSERQYNKTWKLKGKLPEICVHGKLSIKLFFHSCLSLTKAPADFLSKMKTTQLKIYRLPKEQNKD